MQSGTRATGDGGRVAKTRPCQSCGTTYGRTDGFNEDYCSRDCRDRARGERFFRSIQQDHTICFACFRPLKTVEKPHPSDPEWIIGFEYLTEHADYGGKVKTDIPRSYQRCTICTCGSQHQDDYLRDQDPRETLKRLVRVVVATRREGQHEYALDARTLTRTVVETGDWELALGRALE